MTWKKGDIPNPNGRPKGAKDRFTTKFWTDFYNEWQLGGPDALTRVRKNDPSTFVRVAAGLMPKETEVTLRNELDRMTDAELREYIARELAGSSGSSAEVEKRPDKTVTH